MTTTNGHAPITIECPRCDAHGFAHPDKLAAHYVEYHLMNPTQATREARALFSGDRRIVVLPSTHEVPTHACPGCGTKIPCDWEAISRMEHQAALLKIAAAKWRNRKLGLPTGGAARKQDWTDDQAREAYQAGLSLRAIGRLLGAHVDTIKRAVAKENA